MEEKPYQPQCHVETDPHLVASNNIEAGAIILQEEPLVIAPFKETDGPALCLGCCSELQTLEVSCPNCKLPMCGKLECWADGSPHARAECSHMGISEEMKKFETGLFHETWPSKLYPGILGMRLALLQSREPEKWKQFIKLRSFKNCGQISTWTTELESLVRSSIVDFMAKERTVYQDWVMDLFRIFFIDSYQLPALEGTRCEGLRALYFMASFIDHHEGAGEANATKSFTKNGQIVIKASVPITKGSKIILE